MKILVKRSVVDFQLEIYKGNQDIATEGSGARDIKTLLMMAPILNVTFTNDDIEKIKALKPDQEAEFIRPD